MTKKILVVDDEENILELVAYNLENSGYRVVKAMNGKEAMEKFRHEKLDLIVLDVMLPEIDGFELLQIIRRESMIPVLMLTAKADEIDRVLGLEMGADDYLSKPFSPRELVARVKAIMRRSREEENKEDSKKIQSGDFYIDPERHLVELKDKALNLTVKEYELLKTLISNPGKVFTREQLLEMLWDFDFLGDTRTIDVHIRHLRQKIEECGGDPTEIETIRGVGYRYRELK